MKADKRHALYERIRAEVVKKTAETSADQCTCEDGYATSFERNPTGHYVCCPCWGTSHPNRHWPFTASLGK